jgi:hypothetical protein
MMIVFCLMSIQTEGIYGWIQPSHPITHAKSYNRPSNLPTSTTRLYSIFDKFLYDSKIPPELEKEIYEAEANTAAAKDRGTRILVYASLAVIGIMCAVFNGFLTELRATGLPETTTATGLVIPAVLPNTDPVNDPHNLQILQQAGFSWVSSNPVTKFLFTNQIGGGLCLLFGGGSGLLAEAELDSRRINAEKIYEELERRRSQKTTAAATTKNKSSSANKKKKNISGKQKKRMQALSEVVEIEKEDPTTITTTAGDEIENPVEAAATGPKREQQQEQQQQQQGGVLQQMKSLYEKADSMAASQALLLNKQLEDAGVVEKITDETGLKIIGKEEAQKRKQQEQEKEA